MPRTKRPVQKNQRQSSEIDDSSKKLEKLVMDLKKKMDYRAEMEIKNLELEFKILIGSMPKSILQKTIGQLQTEPHFVETFNTTSMLTAPTVRSESHDDGYLTEGSTQGSGDRRPPSAKRTLGPSTMSKSSRRSRSADASGRSALKTAVKPAPRRRSRSVYRTPAYNKNSAVNYPPITPKVAPHTPLTVLRQPRQGEMVVSMSGSPVMVPSLHALQSTDKANCNILLQDGTLLSLQPQQLRQSQAYIPFALMDSDVMRQLQTLKENIDTVVRLGERNGLAP